MKKEYLVQATLFLSLFLFLQLGFSACSSDDSYEPPVATIQIATNDPTVTSQASEVTISFTSSDAWTASSNVDWISLDQKSGVAGSATIKAQVAQNTTYDQRNGAITIKAGSVNKQLTITQKQLDALIVSSNKIEAPAQGRESTIEVKANIAYHVKVDDDCKKWVILLQTKALTTNKVVLKVVENSDIEKREGKVTIYSDDKSEEISIYQQGSDPTLVLSKDVIEANEFGETIKVELKSNIAYEMIMPDADWISINNTRALSSYTHYFNVNENRSNEAREAEIVFTNQELGISESEIVKQKPVSKTVTGKWYLGWWIYGSMNIHFNGNETITFGDDVLTWAGQQDEGGNGDYKLKYADDYKSFVISRSGSENRFYIRLYAKDMLVIQEGGATGAIRYWFTSAEAADASQLSDLPDIVIDDSEIPDPAHEEMNNIADILAIRTGITDSNITPMGQHFEGAHQTTEADKAWLLDPENEPDYLYANENINAPTLTQWRSATVQLYPFGSPEPADVNQHAIGDCSFCAVMASMAYLYPDYIKEIIKDNGNGTYTVRLFDPAGKPVEVCVKSTFLCDGNGTLAQVTGKNNVPTWSTVLEKAVMKYHTLYQVDSLWGIGSQNVAPVLTGNGGSFGYYPNQLWNSELKLLADWSVDEGMLGVGGFTTPNLKCGSLYTVTAHAFTIMKTNHESDGYLFSMRNPWGIEKVDGVLDIPNTRLVCSTIDFRLINAGAAKPYLKTNRGAYVPPVWTRSAVDLGVSRSLLQMTNCQSVNPSPFYLRY